MVERLNPQLWFSAFAARPRRRFPLAGIPDANQCLIHRLVGVDIRGVVPVGTASEGWSTDFRQVSHDSQSSRNLAGVDHLRHLRQQHKTDCCCTAGRGRERRKAMALANLVADNRGRLEGGMHRIGQHSQGYWCLISGMQSTRHGNTSFVDQHFRSLIPR